MTEHQIPAESLKLSDAKVLLYRGQKLMQGRKEIGTIDRMIVQHYTGNEDDIAMVKEAGKLRAKRITMLMEMQAPASPASDVRVTGGGALVDLDEEEEKQMLSIYEKFR